MKKTIFTMALVFASLTINAQEGAYVSLAGGPTYVAGAKLLSNQPGAKKGSNGEGWQAQVRGGYFFTERLAAELSVGYLYGDAQKIIDTDGFDINSNCRAYGATLGGVFNISKNVYVRGGILTKLGGKTKIDGHIVMDVDAHDVNPQVPVGAATVPLIIDFKRDNSGKFPVGFAAGLGCKFPITKNLAIFAELEYQGINVNGNTSKLTDHSITIGGQELKRETLFAMTDGKVAAAVASGNPQYIKAAMTKQYQLNMLVGDEFTYEENPDLTTLKEAKNVESPYSSFGFAFGVTYSFNGFGKNKEVKDKD